MKILKKSIGLLLVAVMPFSQSLPSLAKTIVPNREEQKEPVIPAAPAEEDSENPSLTAENVTATSEDGKYSKTGDELQNMCYHDTLNITAKASDVGSGVHKLYYILGTKEQQTVDVDASGSGSFPLTIDDIKTYGGTLTLWAEDNVGQRSDPVVILNNIALENEGPTLRITPKGTPNKAGWYKGEFRYDVTAADSESGLDQLVITETLNGGIPNIITKDLKGAKANTYEGKLETSLVQGCKDVRLSVEVSDKAGNRASIEDSYNMEFQAPTLSVSYEKIKSDGTSAGIYTQGERTDYAVKVKLALSQLPFSGIKALEYSSDGGNTWLAISNSDGENKDASYHLIDSETNTKWQFRLLTNAYNVTETTGETIHINRTMPEPVKLKITDELELNETNGNWTNAEQRAIITIPACKDPAVRDATQYRVTVRKANTPQKPNIDDSTVDTTRSKIIFPTATEQKKIILFNTVDKNEEGYFYVTVTAEQKVSGIQDTNKQEMKNVLCDNTGPDKANSKIGLVKRNGKIHLKAYVADTLSTSGVLSGGDSLWYNITRKGEVIKELVTAKCDDYGEILQDLEAIGVKKGDIITPIYIYDKALGHTMFSKEESKALELTIPDVATLEDANADITLKIVDDPSNPPIYTFNETFVYRQKTMDMKYSVTLTGKDNSIQSLNFIKHDGEKVEVPVIPGTTKIKDARISINAEEGAISSVKLALEVKDIKGNTYTERMVYFNDSIGPEAPTVMLRTADGQVVPSDGKSNQDVTMTIIPSTQNENNQESWGGWNPAYTTTSLSLNWEYSTDGGATWTKKELTDRTITFDAKTYVDTDNLWVRVNDECENRGTPVKLELHQRDDAAPSSLALTGAGSEWIKTPSVILTPEAADPTLDDAGRAILSSGLATWQYSLDDGNSWSSEKTPWASNGNVLTIMKDGFHNVLFKVKDNAGNESTLQKSIAIKKDSTAPTYGTPIYEHKDSDGNWTGEDFIKWFRFGNFHNETIRVTLPVTDLVSGIKTVTLNTGKKQKALSVNGEGNLVFELKVDTLKKEKITLTTEDHAGNSGVVTLTGKEGSDEWTLETERPSIGKLTTVEGNKNPAGIYDTKLTWQSDVSDADSGLQSIRLELDGKASDIAVTDHTPGGVQQVTGTITEAGTHTITITATDNIGNTRKRSFTLTLDFTKDIGAYITDKDGKPVDANTWTSEEQVTLKVRPAADTTIDVWYYTLDNGNTWSSPQDYEACDTFVIKRDGVYQNQIQVKLKDRKGTTRYTQTINISKDSTPPVLADFITKQTPSEAGCYTEAIDFSIQVADVTKGITTSGIFITGIQIDAQDIQWTQGEGVELAHTIKGQISETGIHQVTVYAMDLAGNQSSKTGTFEIKNEAPSLWIIQKDGAQINPNTWYNQSKMTLKYARTTKNSLKKWEYTLDGGTKWTTGDKTFDIPDGIYQTGGGDTPLTNLIQVRLTDMAKNESVSSAITLKKDSKQPDFPTVTLTGGEKGTKQGEKQWYIKAPQLTVTPEVATDKEAPVYSSYRLDTKIKGETHGFTKEQSLTDALEQGENTLVVTAKDEAGNVAKTSDNKEEKTTTTLYLDTKAPVFEETTFQTVNTGAGAKFINWLTFGNFAKEAINVTVSIHDDNSGIDKDSFTTTIGDQIKQHTIEEKGNKHTVSFQIPLGTDHAAVILSVKDLAGNSTTNKGLKGQGVSNKWNLEDTSPIIGALTASEGKTADGSYDKDIHYSINVTDNQKGDSGIKSVTWQLDHGEIKEAAISDKEATAQFSINDTITEVGTHTITITATDNAGNSDKSTETLTRIATKETSGGGPRTGDNRSVGEIVGMVLGLAGSVLTFGIYATLQKRRKKLR